MYTNQIYKIHRYKFMSILVRKKVCFVICHINNRPLQSIFPLNNVEFPEKLIFIFNFTSTKSQLSISHKKSKVKMAKRKISKNSKFKS